MGGTESLPAQMRYVVGTAGFQTLLQRLEPNSAVRGPLPFETMRTQIVTFLHKDRCRGDLQDMGLCVLVWLAMFQLEHNHGINHWYLLPTDPSPGTGDDQSDANREFMTMRDNYVSDKMWCGTLGFTKTATRGMLRCPYGEFLYAFNTHANLVHFTQAGFLGPLWRLPRPLSAASIRETLDNFYREVFGLRLH